MLEGLTTLLDWLRTNYRTTLARIASLTAHGEITFDLLYGILVPHSILVTRDGATGELRCLRLLTARIEHCGGDERRYVLSCEGVEMADPTKDTAQNADETDTDDTDDGSDDDSDDESNEPKDQTSVFRAVGRAFGKHVSTIYVCEFGGTQKINRLNIYPITYHPDPEGLKAALIKRGRKWASLNGVHHVYYHGLAGRWKDREYVRYNVSIKYLYHTITDPNLKVNSRIMVDRGDPG